MSFMPFQGVLAYPWGLAEGLRFIWLKAPSWGSCSRSEACGRSAVLQEPLPVNLWVALGAGAFRFALEALMILVRSVGLHPCEAFWAGRKASVGGASPQPEGPSMIKISREFAAASTNQELHGLLYHLFNALAVHTRNKAEIHGCHASIQAVRCELSHPAR